MEGKPPPYHHHEALGSEAGGTKHGADVGSAAIVALPLAGQSRLKLAVNEALHQLGGITDPLSKTAVATQIGKLKDERRFAASSRKVPGPPPGRWTPGLCGRGRW